MIACRLLPGDPFDAITGWAALTLVGVPVATSGTQGNHRHHDLESEFDGDSDDRRREARKWRQGVHEPRDGDAAALYDGTSAIAAR